MRGSRKIMSKECKFLLSVLVIIAMLVIYSNTYSTEEECMLKEFKEMSHHEAYTYKIVDDYCSKKFGGN
jgi:hypothetical protein